MVERQCAHARRCSRTVVASPGARLAVAEGGQQRTQLAATAAVLAAGEQGAEPVAPLGQHPVDLRLAEAGHLADLGVGVAAGQQAQRPQLGWLQRPQRLATASDGLASLGLLTRPLSLGRDRRQWVWGALAGAAGPAEQLFAALAHGHRLVSGHRLGPADQFPCVRGRGFGEDDLQGALVGVVGVFRVEREAPGGPFQRVLVAGDHLHRSALASRVGLRSLGATTLQSCSPHRSRLPLFQPTELPCTDSDSLSKHANRRRSKSTSSPPSWTSDRSGNPQIAWIRSCRVIPRSCR